MNITRVPSWVTQTNCYIVDVGNGCGVLIDAPPDPETIGAIVNEQGLSVAAIILTHGHVDHTGGVGDLVSELGAAAYVHPDDDFLTLHPEEQLRQLFGLVPQGSYRLPLSFETLTNGETLEFGGFAAEVRHTPGHTPGHCCFWMESEGVLFSGDQLFAGSIGRTDLPGGNLEQLMDSMKSQVLTLDDEVAVLPGHGETTTIGEERRFNPFLRSVR